jgi:IclR family pca regulon transcriptional regulator
VLPAALAPAALDDYLASTELVKLTARTIDSEPALRAELERVRERGYALVDGEREEGVRSDAALNVSANAARISVETLRDEVVPLLRETAEAISRDIGYVSP